MEITDKVYLYGASGHAKVILDMLADASVTVPCLIDDNPSVNELAGVPVVHSAEGLDPFIVSIGDCQIRRRIVEKLSDHQFVSVVHRSAIVSRSSLIGDGTVVMAGAILQSGAVIGRHCIINSGASVDHDTSIGDFVHVAPHCTLCGGVSVGEGTWIGAGTTVIQGIRIGRDCFIGAGSVVVRDVPDNVVAYGNPCKVVKQIVKNIKMNENQMILKSGGGNRLIPSDCWVGSYNSKNVGYAA